jgi:hypothetical protein
MLAPLVAKGLGELGEGAFRSGIRRDSESTLEGKQRTDIDDLSAAKGDHMSARFLGKQPRDLEIEVEDLQDRETPDCGESDERFDKS